MLVTSSNNTAVENITKELPLEKGILDNLKIVSDGNMPDSPEKAQQLRTICKMFSTSETEKKLNVYQKDTKRQGEYPEIYFTGYAKKFFGNAEKERFRNENRSFSRTVTSCLLMLKNVDMFAV